MLVSIITVSYNSRTTIEETIKSVLAQSYKNIEYIIVDGASTDGTLSVLNNYKSKISRVISEPDKGIYDAMNKGIKSSSGEIVGFLNADDVFYNEESIEKIVSGFKNFGSDCVYGNLIYVSSQNPAKINRVWKSRTFKDGLFEKSWTPAHPTFYCKRVLYDKLGAYRTDFKISSDTELMYRFLQKAHIKSYFINEYLVRMRDGGLSSRGIKSTLTITREMKQAINENGGNFNIFKYLFYKFLKIKELLSCATKNNE